MPPALQLLKWLAPDDRRIARLAQRTARRQRAPLYLVGGVVRDLVLGRTPKDLDFVVEASVEDFARDLAASLGADWEWESGFLTATVWVNGRAVNVACARTEKYPRPGVLPVVTRASIGADLPRRDFSVNAMALGLEGRDRGRLLDPCGGIADVKRRVLRVLHPRSFIDDPTRTLRGVRLSARLRMRFDPATAALARSAIEAGMLNRVSADRWRCEILLLLEEPDPLAALAEGRRVGVIRELLPGLRTGRSLRTALRGAPALAKACGQEAEGIRLLVLVGSTRSPIAVAKRLGLRGSLAAAAAALGRLMPTPRALISARPSAAVRILERLPIEAVCALAMLTRSKSARKMIGRYLLHWRLLKPSISGDDLLRLGVAPGPAVGAGLRAARYALIEGRARTRREQLAVALAGSRQSHRR